ncbi:MAG: NHLP bacteriocin system secretion protein [Alphaproteobacteria bacterium]|nr:NHLP bacteriocin system secretion protein [Alphaproteobacteria bacterium]
MREIFRKTALDRHVAPEPTDRRVALVGRGSVAALVFVGLGLAVALAWGILGRIPTYATAEGILVERGGALSTVEAPGAGVVTRLIPALGDTVKRGQVLALLERGDTEQRVANARESVEERNTALERLRAQIATVREVRRASAEARRKALDDQLVAARRRADLLRQQVADNEELAAKGVVARRSVQQTRADQLDSLGEVARINSQASELDYQEQEFAAQQQQRILDAEFALEEAHHQLKEIESQARFASEVRATADGRLIEAATQAGESVVTGQTLFVLERAGEGLEALLFVPPRQGKLIAAVQPANIEPSHAKREEFGVVLGDTEWVSEFPSTPPGMKAVLRNDDLVRAFSKDGAPFAARVKLRRDPQTTNGFAWSSRRGAEMTLSPGTLVKAEVTVREQAPITLMLPLLRELSGL